MAPDLGFSELDVLVVDEIGKNIAGAGFDLHVVGRYCTPYVSGGPRITRLVTLDVTEASHGNTSGAGLSDVTTARLFAKADFEQTYPNVLTATVPLGSGIPMVMPSDRRAIQAAICMANVPDDREVRLLRIRNTSEMEMIHVSAALLADLPPDMVAAGPLGGFDFDPAGNLF